LKQLQILNVCHVAPAFTSDGVAKPAFVRVGPLGAFAIVGRRDRDTACPRMPVAT